MPSKKNNNKPKNVGKKLTKKTTVVPEEQHLTQEPVETPVVVEEAAPVASKQTGGSKKNKKANKKSKVVTEVASETVSQAVTEAVTEVASETVSQAVTEAVTDTTTNSKQTAGGKKVRSFKVRLPNSEIFEGRFTGLTPYQAANKALSKYYRENGNKSKGHILFSIKESTRGSKRSTYTYNGKREKLVKPVEYSIENGKTIVKNYKNKLTKVKKAELATMNLSL